MYEDRYTLTDVDCRQLDAAAHWSLSTQDSLAAEQKQTSHFERKDIRAADLGVSTRSGENNRGLLSIL